MKKQIVGFALALAIFSSSQAEAAARFWVGGDGTWDASTTTHWAASSGGAGGQTVPGSADTVTFDGNSGAGTGAGGGALVTLGANAVMLQFALGTTGGNFVGSLNTAGFSVTAQSFAYSGSGTRGLTCGSSVFHLGAAGVGAGVLFDLTTITGLTISCASATVSLENTANTTPSVVMNGQSFGPLVMSANTNPNYYSFTSSSNFTSVSLTAPLNIGFSPGTTHTWGGGFSFAGTSTNLIYLFSNTSASTTATIAAGSASTCSWCVFKGIAGSTNTITATNAFNLSTGSSIGTLSISPPSAGGSPHYIGTSP